MKLSTKKLGSCIEKSRPYYEALEQARIAQIECQNAAAKFQRANGNKFSFTLIQNNFPSFLFLEIHIAAKETVHLAEQRFMSNSHEWQFDQAWQDMLNHATLKVNALFFVFFVIMFDVVRCV